MTGREFENILASDSINAVEVVIITTNIHPLAIRGDSRRAEHTTIRSVVPVHFAGSIVDTIHVLVIGTHKDQILHRVDSRAGVDAVTGLEGPLE